MDPELFAKCSLTLSKEISSQRDDALLTAITELKFKITGFAELTIEKENVTERDARKLIKLLKSKLEPRLGDDFVIVHSENEVNHKVPSDGIEKSYRAVKKEGPVTQESLEQMSGPSDVTEESQSPEKIRNALKDSVASQPTDTHDEVDRLNSVMRNLSLSDSQTEDSPSTSTSQIMTGVSHQDSSDNLELISSEENRECGSALRQHMSSSQPVVSQQTGAAPISSQKSDYLRGKMPTGAASKEPHPPVKDGEDKPGKSNQQTGGKLSSSDTQHSRRMKRNDHEGNTSEMSSQDRRKPEGKTHKPTELKDSNRDFGAEDQDRVKDGYKNDTAVPDEDAVQDKMGSAITASRKKTKKLEEKSLEGGNREGSKEGMEDSDVSAVSSLGSYIGDEVNSAVPCHGNKDMQSDMSQREGTEQVSAEQELIKVKVQAQRQSSISSQRDGMEESREGGRSQKKHRHEPLVNQDMTDDVEVTPDDRSNTITKTRGSHSEMLTSQDSDVMKVKGDQNAAGNCQRDNLLYASPQTRKIGGQHQSGEHNQQSGYTPDKGDRHKREMSQDAQTSQYRESEITEQVILEKSLRRRDKQMMESEEEEAKGLERKEKANRQKQEEEGNRQKKEEKAKRQKQEEMIKREKQAEHHSNDTVVVNDREKQPYGQDRSDSHADMNRSTQSEESYIESAEQWSETGDMNQRRPEQHTRYGSEEGDEHGRHSRQTRTNKCGESEEQRRYRESKHQTGSQRQQREDGTGDVNSKELSHTLNREDSEPSMGEHEEREKQGKMTGDVNHAGSKNKKLDNNPNEIDRDEIEGAQSELNTQGEMNFHHKLPHDELDERFRKLKPGGITIGQRRDDSDEDNELNMPRSPHEDSGSDSQSSRNELRQLGGHRRKQEGSHPGRSGLKVGVNTDEDDENRADSEAPSVPRHHGVFQNQDSHLDNADQDGNETPGSDNQSNSEDDTSNCASSGNSAKQNDGNPSKTFDNKGADLNDNKHKHMKVRHGVEKVSQGDQTTHQIYSGDKSAGGRNWETAAQQADVKNMKGSEEEQEMEYDTEIQGENHSHKVKNPPTTKVVKGQNLQNDDPRRRRANGDKGSSQKHRMETEINDVKEMKKEKGGKIGKDTSYADQPDTESDEESSSIEYVMKKTHFRLAEQYFEGCREHRYFNEAEGSDEGFLFIMNSKNTEQARFIKLLRKLKFERVGHAEDDRPQLKKIEDQLKCTDSNVKLLELGSKSYLVGSKEKVAEVKQKFISKLQETVEDVNNLDTSERSRRQRSQPDRRDVAESSSKSSDGGTRPKNFDEFRRSKDKDSDDPNYGRDYTRSSSYQGDSVEKYGRGADPGVYAGRYSDIKVHIHNTDITTLKVDCIVNAANTKLKHGGGVARVIATAAGRELQEACARFIAAGKTVPVTGLFVSPGGYLPAKHVLHAVGPKWDLYDERDKRRCTDDLRRTVLRCFVEAMRLGMSSIALPSISAAIFKVPKEHCARSYMNAVKHFEEIVRKDDYRDCTLKEIHFVDVDDTMVNYIRECFMNNWREPSDPYARQADEKVFQEQLKSAKSQPPGNQISGHSQKPHRPPSPGGKPTGLSSVPSSNVTGATAKNVGKDTVYQVGELQLCISCRPALSIRSNLVITAGEEFDKLSGISDYSIKANKKPCEDVPKKKSCTFSYVHKPDGKYGQLLCRLFPDPKSPADLSSAFENLDAAVRVAALRGDKVRDVKSFVLTSSVLYAEPSNKRKKTPNASDRKLVGNFGKLVFDYVEKLSKESSCKVKQVVVTASEDVSVQLCKIMETRPGIKNVDTSAPGAYPHTKSTGQSPARWDTGSRGGSTSSFNAGHTHYGQQYSSGHYEKEHSSHGGISSVTGADYRSSSGSPVDQRLICRICYFAKETTKPTSCCRKLLCKDCNDKVSSCPYCLKTWKTRIGIQPRGFMIVTFTNDSAYGYESKGSWVIEYNFPSGTQMSEHPNPGQRYDGTRRTAYIPAIEGSIDLLKLLRLAFIRRLTFTIGTSHTTGKDNKITWNDIHHKTNLHGGNFGFPDPYYFQRVLQELRDKGVIWESLTEAESVSMKEFEEELKSIKFFSDYSAKATAKATALYY